MVVHKRVQNYLQKIKLNGLPTPPKEEIKSFVPENKSNSFSPTKCGLKPLIFDDDDEFMAEPEFDTNVRQKSDEAYERAFEENRKKKPKLVGTFKAPDYSELLKGY